MPGHLWGFPTPSLPVRECGLKSVIAVVLALILSSLPVRECGLKLRYVSIGPGPGRVTPRAGVWIEIVNCSSWRLCRGVTPRAGVWIEIRAVDGIVAAVNRHSPCGSVD